MHTAFILELKQTARFAFLYLVTPIEIAFLLKVISRIPKPRKKIGTTFDIGCLIFGEPAQDCPFNSEQSLGQM